MGEQGMEQQQERYKEARAWLAFLIDHPDKTVSVNEYRAQLKSAQKSVAAARKAMGARE